MTKTDMGTPEPGGLKLGALIDMLYSRREDRLNKQAQVEILKRDEEVLKQTILGLLKETGLASARGYIATAAATSTRTVQVTDWDEYYTYLLDERKPELLQRRPSTSLVLAHYDDGILVPGTAEIVLPGLSLTKAKR